MQRSKANKIKSERGKRNGGLDWGGTGIELRNITEIQAGFFVEPAPWCTTGSIKGDEGKEHKITVLPRAWWEKERGWGWTDYFLYSTNNEINKSEAVNLDGRADNKYLMCLFHYSVSVKASVGVSVTVSAALAVWSMALERNTEGIHCRRAVWGRFLLTCTMSSRYYQRQTLKVPVDRTS